MADTNEHRNPDGTFRVGHRYSSKRKNYINYSLARELATLADEPDKQAIDDEGNQITRARAAALWLWRVAVHGVDRRQDSVVDVSAKDRVTAIQTIMGRIMPEKIATDQDEQDEHAERVAGALGALTDQQRDAIRAVLAASDK